MAKDGMRLPLRSVLITGPFMPKAQRRRIMKRARQLGVRFYRFYRQMEKIIAAADLVVSMGGYNTICEILSHGTPSLIIPRQAPRKEQLIRAQALRSRNLIEYIPMNELTPASMQKKILTLVESPGHYQEAMARFQLTGIETMCQRIYDFRCRRA